MTEAAEEQQTDLPKDYGTLIPKGGGDPIPLLKKNLLIGRRESCDIVLRFKNVSAHHCQLTVRGGYWYIKDLKSLNGVKVNNVSVTDRRLQSGDTLSIAKHSYRIYYVPADLGAVGPPPPDEPPEEIFGDSLLKRAGLEPARRHPASQRKQKGPDATDGSQPASSKPDG